MEEACEYLLVVQQGLECGFAGHRPANLHQYTVPKKLLRYPPGESKDRDSMAGKSIL